MIGLRCIGHSNREGYPPSFEFSGELLQTVCGHISHTKPIFEILQKF